MITKNLETVIIESISNIIEAINKNQMETLYLENKRSKVENCLQRLNDRMEMKAERATGGCLSRTHPI